MATGRRVGSGTRVCCRTIRQPWPQHGKELGLVDRLGHVAVGPGVHAAFALAGRDLAGDGDHREVLVLLVRADGPDGVVAVHDGHHDVHQDDVDVRPAIETSRRLRPGLHDRHLRACLFEKGRERVEVAGVVVDHQELDTRDGPVTQLHQGPPSGPVGLRR